MATEYICVIDNNFSGGERKVTTKSAMKCAFLFGSYGGDETITVCYKSGKIIDRVKYTPENGGRYYRVNF